MSIIVVEQIAHHFVCTVDCSISIFRAWYDMPSYILRVRCVVSAKVRYNMGQCVFSWGSVNCWMNGCYSDTCYLKICISALNLWDALRQTRIFCCKLFSSGLMRVWLVVLPSERPPHIWVVYLSQNERICHCQGEFMTFCRIFFSFCFWLEVSCFSDRLGSDRVSCIFIIYLFCHDDFYAH